MCYRAQILRRSGWGTKPDNIAPHPLENLPEPHRPPGPAPPLSPGSEQKHFNFIFIQKSRLEYCASQYSSNEAKNNQDHLLEQRFKSHNFP